MPTLNAKVRTPVRRWRAHRPVWFSDPGDRRHQSANDEPGVSYGYSCIRTDELFSVCQLEALRWGRWLGGGITPHVLRPESGLGPPGLSGRPRCPGGRLACARYCSGWSYSPQNRTVVASGHLDSLSSGVLDEPADLLRVNLRLMHIPTSSVFTTLKVCALWFGLPDELMDPKRPPSYRARR